MTKDEFKPVMRFLAAGCRVEFAPHEVAAWYAALRDIPANVAAIAVARFVCEFGKWPDIATIRRFADEAANGTGKLWPGKWSIHKAAGKFMKLDLQVAGVLFLTDAG